MTHIHSHHLRRVNQEFSVAMSICRSREAMHYVKSHMLFSDWYRQPIASSN